MKKLIFLIANQRSGTTAFKSCLNEKNFFLSDEKFNENNFLKKKDNFYNFKKKKIIENSDNILPKNFFLILNEFVSTIYDKKLEVFGIDVKYNHCYQIPNFFEYIKKLNEHYKIKIIHLKRKNYFNTALSEIMMHKNFKNKIVIDDVSKFIKRAKRIKFLTRKVSSDLKTHHFDTLDISYENLFFRENNKDFLNSKVIDKLENFLNYKFNRTNLYSKIDKKLPLKFCDTVENYKEIKIRLNILEKILIS